MPVKVFAYCTNRDAAWPDFPHQPEQRRDLSTPGFDQHLIEMVTQIFEKSGGEISQSVYGVCRHLQRTNVILTFDVEAEFLEAIAPWAWNANAILFLPDGNIRDPNGAVLVERETMQPDPSAQLPYPQDARQRKAQNEQELRNRQIDTPDALPPVVGLNEVHLRAADDVAWRALALFVVAVRAESLASGNPISEEALRQKQPLAFQALTPWEQQFISDDSPAEEDISAAGWRYESLATLQWVLGMTPSLPFPDVICDVPAAATLMMSVSAREFVAGAKLRPVDQILDAMDLNYRLLWAARQATVQSVDPPSGIEGGVIAERQHSLNWLTCFENAEWDNVDIPS
ncbi:DUF4272 domain-containing protein [Rhodopirellula sp. MGV]|uniref:DUF4272 domain-containing protein n=1 Tax=Rhodopirellula sp. MGV TaxID=2023130 RepID=UPI000B95D66C|nr:DUF4272 domain-containing protein [Rhodopirellula sp. MGV]OYP29398.1 hypothetical protein CGZ80_24630 [Rhodopirellula sp. MGV]PNY35704.1 DUF4272 domain-containing protein [Rhodopirellula baltica]